MLLGEAHSAAASMQLASGLSWGRGRLGRRLLATAYDAAAHTAQGQPQRGPLEQQLALVLLNAWVYNYRRV